MPNLENNWPQIENEGINVQNEGSMHAAIKSWYAQPGDRFEVKVAGYIIDIVREDLLLEVQTRNFTSIRKKLLALLKDGHKLQLIHPITVNKWIVKEDADQQVINRRKSPKKGKLINIFAELVRIPHLLEKYLLKQENFSLVILFVDEEEIRRDDGKGSWRRKGVSIIDRRLLQVRESYHFYQREDFLAILPSPLAEPFSNKILAKGIGCSVEDARKLTYTFKKMGLIEEVGKQGNELLFALNKL